MALINKLGYVEKDAAVWVATWDVYGKPVQYVYRDVPLAIWNRLNAIYKQSNSQGYNPSQLHGMIWMMLKKYPYDKSTEDKLASNIQMKLAGM